MIFSDEQDLGGTWNEDTVESDKSPLGFGISRKFLITSAAVLFSLLIMTASMRFTYYYSGFCMELSKIGSSDWDFEAVKAAFKEETGNKEASSRWSRLNLYAKIFYGSPEYSFEPYVGSEFTVDKVGRYDDPNAGFYVQGMALITDVSTGEKHVMKSEATCYSDEEYAQLIGVIPELVVGDTIRITGATTYEVVE